MFPSTRISFLCRPCIPFAWILGAILGLAMHGLFPRGLPAQDAAQNTPQSTIDFNRDIQPILAEHCLKCHGPETSEAGLDLSRRVTATGLLESGVRAIVEGAPDQSELLRRVQASDADVRMPPPDHAPLKRIEVERLRRWIAEGASYDLHWAFKPLMDLSQLHSTASDSTVHPIDRFVERELATVNASLSPEADPHTLIKRVYLDLLGLLPNPEETSSFVDAYRSANSPEKEALYEQLVDRCLASAHFGERWGRHWLDLARFADSDGYEKDRTRPDAYVYRDWVINAWNQNMPFDQFSIEQLAGDLLPHASPQQRIATAFHRQTLTNTEGGVDQEEYRIAANFDRTDTLGTIWFGLTIGCAKCHTHKYDPITHREYFELFAYFNEGDEQSEELPINLSNNSPILPELWAVESQLKSRYGELFEAQQAWEREQRERVEADENKSLKPEDLQLSKEVFNALKMYPEKRTNETRELLFGFFTDRDDEVKRLKAIQKELLDRSGSPVMSIRVFAPSRSKRKTHRLERGDFLSPAERVDPGIPTALLDENSSKGALRDRLELAKWMMGPSNPLTPRVVANQIWLRLFGQGIVRTVGDFGVRGEGPSHPELLDWLATHFRDQLDWNTKAFIKSILLSRTYRQSSVHRVDMSALDPLNRLLSRQNRLRLEGEIVRDISLQASGLLSRKIGGQSVFPPMPPELAKLSYANNFTWKVSEGEDRYRRGMYTFFKRTIPHPTLMTFDCPDANAAAISRTPSNTPLQALTLLNNETFLEASVALAQNILRAQSSEDELLKWCFLRCLTHEPSSSERIELRGLLERARAIYHENPAWASELLSARPESEGPVAELASWSIVARAY